MTMRVKILTWLVFGGLIGSKQEQSAATREISMFNFIQLISQFSLGLHPPC